jgi:AcrR family transcriptional regulator
MSIEAPNTTDSPTPNRRPRLTRERVLATAVDLADRSGAEALSMRKLAQELGVDPMALYRHVRNKDDLLDGVLAVVVGQMEPAPPGLAWQVALRQLAMNARRVMLRHPWARGVLEERGTSGEAMVGQVERVLSILLGAGFSLELAHHALHALDSRIFGFSPALFDESRQPAPPPEASAALALVMASHFPNVAQLAAAASHEGVLGACDDDVEFAFGLDLVLDGLERAAASRASG